MSSSETSPTRLEKEPEVRSFLDTALRPRSWDGYIGQEHIKKNLSVLLKAAQYRSHPPEHLLFYGPPGLGKTTLAHLIAHELGVQIKITSGPAIERVGDLASVLTNLSSGEILFIDEIHRLNKTVEEILYPAMESGMLDIIIGKGPSARSIQLELAPFTMIAATTRVGLISSPLRSRFSGGVFKLEFYNNDELARIIERSAKILGLKITPEAAEVIAVRSRYTPRTANYLLKRCRDFAEVNNFPHLSPDVVHSALGMLDIDSLGLTPADRLLLEIIIAKFSGGPVGITTLSAASAEENGTIEEVYEPYLLRAGLIERTPRGRMATKLAYQHLGLAYPEHSSTLDATNRNSPAGEYPWFSKSSAK
jgi:holliday junction DNA helicase RuvB